MRHSSSGRNPLRSFGLSDELLRGPVESPHCSVTPLCCRRADPRRLWKAVHGPDVATSVRDFGCPHSDLSDVNEEELDGERLEAAIKMHQFL